MAPRAAAPRPAFVLKRDRPEGTPASSRGGARRGPAGGAGITGAHTALHLRDLQVLVELDGNERAVGLGHVHLVHAVTGVGLDPVDGATRNRLERRRTERRGRAARYPLLVGTDRLGAAGPPPRRIAAAQGGRSAAACRGSAARGRRAQRASDDATDDCARSQQANRTHPPFLALAGSRRVVHRVISFWPWPPTLGDHRTNVPPRPVRFVKPSSVPPMTDCGKWMITSRPATPSPRSPTPCSATT